MCADKLDETDRAILHALQQDARNSTSDEIAEQIDAASSTVRKRIKKLESEGIIKRHTALVDYEESGYPIRMLLFCTADIPNRGAVVDDILEIPEVIAVQELVTGQNNLLVTAVGETDSDITPVAQELLDMGLTISDEVLVRSHVIKPFDKFSPDHTTE